MSTKLTAGDRAFAARLGQKTTTDTSAEAPKHTPGKLYVSHEDDRVLIRAEEEPKLYAELANGGAAVAICYGTDRRGNARRIIRALNNETDTIQALKELKAACIDVLLPAINEAIKAGYKMETWTPEQYQWAQAVAIADAAIAQAEGRTT